MSDENNVSDEPSRMQRMRPYLIVAGILLCILLAIILWPVSEPEPKRIPVAETNVVTEPAKPITQITEPDLEDVKPDVFEAPPRPSEVQIGADMQVDEFEAEEIVEEIPLDTSDATVKAALMAVATSPSFGKLLVNERLIEKFVINVHNLSSSESSPNDSLVLPPEQTFATYEQADRTWIESASFQRYNLYVDVLESIDIQDMLTVFDEYEATIVEKYSEISRPGSRFNDDLIDAINILLDTPKVPVPIEVFSDSVMYKFKDPRIESLTGPQKQLIRTGPENMRRIKAVLRSIKDALESR